MSAYLVAAAVLTFFIGATHSILGEKYIIRRLLKRDLPKNFGSDRFTKYTIHFAWHLTTVAWWTIAGVLLLIAYDRPVSSILDLIAAGWLVATFLALIPSRGFHLAWIVFLAIAILCAYSARFV